MGVSLGGSGTGGNRALGDKGIHEEAAEKKCGVCHREANLKTMYRCGEYGGIQ